MRNVSPALARRMYEGTPLWASAASQISVTVADLDVMCKLNCSREEAGIVSD